MKKVIFLVSLFSFYGFSIKKENNYVPNSKTAIKIAEAVWLPIFGENIYNKMPFVAELIDSSIWHVHGTLPYSRIIVNENGDRCLSYKIKIIEVKLKQKLVTIKKNQYQYIY